MLFSSYTFLLAFLPAVLLLTGLLPLFFPKRLRLAVQNAVLLGMSLLFYAWGEPVYVLLMLATILVNDLLARCISRCRHRRAVLTLAVVLDLSLLFFFKYAPPLAACLSLPFPALHLPLGISFYTFQVLSYVVDVYREDAAPAKSPALLGTYITLFPQLIAGPIVRYTELAGELTDRRQGIPEAAAGTRRFLAGLCKKLLLANPAGELFVTLTGAGTPTLAGAWLALLGFAFQIYFDFSGYSDMAIGLGQILGFHFPENFNYPYTAQSFSDFWRRWHITLSSFFREYVYIPLGGSRRGTWRTLRNLLIVWTLTGLWHGAARCFLLWGLYWFCLLAAEKLLPAGWLAALPTALRRIPVLFGILFGWAIFAFDGSTPALSPHACLAFFGALFGGTGVSSPEARYALVRHLPFLALCVLGSTPLPRRWYRQLIQRRALAPLAWLLPLAGAGLSLAYLADSGFNPFLYFRF